MEEEKNWAEDLEGILDVLRYKYYEQDLYLDAECGFGYGTRDEAVTVHALWLPRNERGKGIGTKVMEELIEECRKAGFFVVQLEAIIVDGEEIDLGLVDAYGIFKQVYARKLREYSSEAVAHEEAIRERNRIIQKNEEEIWEIMKNGKKAELKFGWFYS